MSQQLSSREANLFRSVIRSYEDKHYKRGLKAAEQILRKNPRHGDTMAMKALIMNSQGKTEEAFALAKEALTADMKSHTCWHVYGILYRTNKNFEEAIKAYKFALRLDPESTRISTDLASLQVQMRDYQGNIQTRLAMLRARPEIRLNWVALAVAHHLEGNLEEAERVLTQCEETMKMTPVGVDLVHSELILYKNTIIAERGDVKRALDHIEGERKNISDRLALQETTARYMAQLGQKEEAARAYRALLDRNPDHVEYYMALIKVLGIEGDETAMGQILDEYAERYPRCDVARRLPLDFLSGDRFLEAGREYIKHMFRKGVPSTFANLKHLYKDTFKRQMVPVLAEEFVKQVQQGSDRTKEEGAALYFLAQHFDYRMSRDLEKATEYIEKAIELDAKSVDFHMTKARILKHAGDLQKASERMDYARSLDARDRYINSKAVKYQLRNNENEKALSTMSLFTRPDAVGGHLAEVADMQCIWFLTEDGEAWRRRGDVGQALKRFHTVYSIFDIWQEDQFDFHSFSLRKGQLRAYVDMIHWEDRLREHPFYTRAALNAVDLYLSLYEKRLESNGVNGVEGNNGTNTNAAEKKKAAKKAKKEAQKAERKAANGSVQKDPNKAPPKGEEPNKKDDDPLGIRLAATTDPLGDAVRFLVPLLERSPRNMDGQIAGFEVYLRRKKYVLALGCLSAVVALDKQHPKLASLTKSFGSTIQPILDSLPSKVQEVIKSEFAAVAQSVDV